MPNVCFTSGPKTSIESRLLPNVCLNAVPNIDGVLLSSLGSNAVPTANLRVAVVPEESGQIMRDRPYDRSNEEEPDVNNDEDTSLNSKEPNHNSIIGNKQKTSMCISNNIEQGATYNTNPENGKSNPMYRNPEVSTRNPGNSAEDLKRNNNSRNKFSNDREKNCVKKKKEKNNNSNNNVPVVNKANKVEDIPAFTSFNVQRLSQANRQVTRLKK